MFRHLGSEAPSDCCSSLSLQDPPNLSTGHFAKFLLCVVFAGCDDLDSHGNQILHLVLLLLGLAVWRRVLLAHKCIAKPDNAIGLTCTHIYNVDTGYVALLSLEYNIAPKPYEIV